MKKRVAIGFLGVSLDAGKRDKRWERWRPTVALCQQPHLPVDRLELIHDIRATSLAERIAEDIGKVSPGTEVVRHIMNLSDAWDFQEVYAALYDFARAYPFDADEEDYLVNITTGTHVAQICWFLLTEAHYVPGKLIQLSPPKFSPPKSSGAQPDVIGSHSIVDLDLSRYDAIASRFRAEAREATSFLKSGIPTRNTAFNAMIDQIERVAMRSRAPVLLTGPTGAGKSMLARRIFELKQARRQLAGSFIEVNCATLRGDHTMSALFGHVRGAFTGAQSERAGLLRAADGGLLFMDEIGELGLDEQAMILRAIEEKRFLPVGADKEALSDFQLIAGTNRDLSVDVRSGKFREDLLARLNLWTFDLPGLAARREDIEPNLDFELTRYAEKEGENITFNREARTRYLAFATAPEARWTANFRDLSASVTRMATLAPGGRINEEVVEEEIRRLQRHWRAGEREGGDQLLVDLLGEEWLAGIDRFDQVQLAEVVRICRVSSTLSAAGRALFAASRQAKASANDADRLRKYLARFELDWEAVRG
ncbi:transcriptional regulator [Labrys miyagiensis]|uniref:Transcriptional regulator n=1 Tax=Labrys miyagiensis TaxID=346912 RepID=A0ABQ6CRX3_9HYPH|nr:RNA repair transcriptional activator RtcR [Labrys miyagiensis]GLS23103.1 transcriptional regulator [Labrys miyagiensis]